MKITMNREGSHLTVALSGRLDSMTAPELEQELTGQLDDVTDFLLDFTGLEYVSSAGLRVLLWAQKKMQHQGKMHLRCVRPEIMEIFDMTGFSTMLIIENE